MKNSKGGKLKIYKCFTAKIDPQEHKKLKQYLVLEEISGQEWFERVLAQEFAIFELDWGSEPSRYFNK